MFSTRIPRSSFLDSPLRVRSHENRRLATATRPSPSPIGHGHRLAEDRPSHRALGTVAGRVYPRGR